MQLGINLPRDKVKRSEVKDTGGRIYFWKPVGYIPLDPWSQVDRGVQSATATLPVKTAGT